MTRFRIVSPFGLAAATLLFAQNAAAEQFVAFDISYEHNSVTAPYSHHWVKPSPETPANLVSPVDYSKGTVYYYLEVISKPSAQPTQFHNCFGTKPHYSCGPYAPKYTTTGVYEWSAAVPKFSYFDMSDWKQGMGSTSFILTDPKLGNVGPEQVGAATAALFTPSKLRVVVTFVSPGGTYVRPNGAPATPRSADAGTTAPARATAPDAGVLVNTDLRPDALATVIVVAAEPQVSPPVVAAKPTAPAVDDDNVPTAPDAGETANPARRHGVNTGCSMGGASEPIASCFVPILASAFIFARMRRTVKGRPERISL